MSFPNQAGSEKISQIDYCQLSGLKTIDQYFNQIWIESGDYRQFSNLIDYFSGISDSTLLDQLFTISGIMKKMSGYHFIFLI